MTIEEKRREIRNKCSFNCGECPLSKVVDGTIELCYSEPTKIQLEAGIIPPNIERNYALLFGGENKEPDHDGCKGCKHELKEENECPCRACRHSFLASNPLYIVCPDLYEPKNSDNPYWERINAIAEQQRAKGINKYGAGLESNPAAIMERINHLQEELIDGLYYCEWIKDHLSECGEE